MNVVGARPNFVKIAPLISEMRKCQDISPLLVHTGQHYDEKMSDSFFRDLEIPVPDYNLCVPPGLRVTQVSEIMVRLAPVVMRERPDVVLVVGDVNSTLAAALTAVRSGVPVAHVEAGLRSFDLRMPEEVNRVMTDEVSDLMFVTEPSGVENLLKEGKPPQRIFLVGNVMIDSLKRALRRMEGSAISAVRNALRGTSAAPSLRYAVLTLHRQGLVDDPVLFGKVWKVLEEIGYRVPIIFPVHPRTHLRMRQIGCRRSMADEDRGNFDGIHMIPPMGYLEFLSLQRQAAFVLTDSGGVQEETTALGVPCLTLRENTERPFTVTNGTNTIVGFDPELIHHEVSRVLSGGTWPRQAPGLWDGRAAERIVGILRENVRPGRQRFPDRAELFDSFSDPIQQYAPETDAGSVGKKTA